MLQVEEHDSGTESDDEAPRSHGESCFISNCLALATHFKVHNFILVSTYVYAHNMPVTVHRILFIHALFKEFVECVSSQV